MPQYKTPTIGQSIKEGFGFGIGSRIAHNLIIQKKRYYLLENNLYTKYIITAIQIYIINFLKNFLFTPFVTLRTVDL